MCLTIKKMENTSENCVFGSKMTNLSKAAQGALHYLICEVIIRKLQINAHQKSSRIKPGALN